MIVRSAHDGDAQAIVAATSALPLLVRYGVTEASMKRDLERALAAGDGLLVAEEGPSVLGFAWFLPRGGLGFGGYLKLIAVAPAHAGRRVGQALLAEVERSVAVDAKHMMLLVSDFNEGAQRFYRRAGYEERGAFPGLVLPGVTERLFYKSLRYTDPTLK